MTSITTSLKPKRTTLHAVVTRADGTVEDLGMIAYHHWFTPWSLLVNLMIDIKRRFTG